jgi:ferric-dicitrate binding protein FerR (iron transport regulator)
MTNKFFKQLCIKAITDNINESEKELLNKCLAECIENKIEFDKIKSIWTNTAQTETLQIPDIDTGWNDLENKLNLSEGNYPAKDSILDKINNSIKPFLTLNWKPAFGIALVVLCIIAGFLIFNKEESNLKFITISTINKEHKQIDLPDGSTAYLNSNSNIKYLEIFDDKVRRIYLQGEAYFSVIKDKRPFIISTDNAMITVIGTKFNVYSRDEKTRIIVKEGRVSVAPSKTNTNGIVLSDGQQSIINKDLNPTSPQKVDPEFLLGWMEGNLVFNQTPLYEIAAELKRQYNIDVRIKEDNLKQYTLTGSFNKIGIDSVLNMICLSLDVEYEKGKEGYLIKTKNIIR